MLAPEEGKLHIDRITVEDQGLYTCEVTNEKGSVESSAYISVESKYKNNPKIIMGKKVAPSSNFIN